MTFQQWKTVLGYGLITVLIFAIFSHIIWPNTDMAIQLFIIIIVLFAFYFYCDQKKETVLCLVVKDDQVLMMLRNKKKNDVHLNKYNGLGGKLERGESKKRALLREVKEEANITLMDYHYVGKIFFKNFGRKKSNEIMYCYVSYDYDGELSECNEGELVWIPKEEVLSLNLWEGDQYFIMNIIENKKFKGFIEYDGDKVVDYSFKYKNNDH